MRVLITGATGLVGNEIVKLCREKEILISYLTTSKSKIENKENYKGFYWNPNTGEIDENCFENVDVIIHLAGATIAKRWTKSYKKEILESRVKSTELIYNTLINIEHSVTQIISASAIGVYPDSQTNYYNEDYKTQTEDSFLTKVVHVWEQEVEAFKKLDIAVAKVRIGLVLSEKGGALPQIIKPAKIGLAAAFGTGKQWQSWIHITDLARLFLYILKYHLTGVFNAVAPNAVTNRELTKTVTKILEVPYFMPNIPKVLMKLVLGEMHILLFESQRVSSKKIENKGFNFKFNYLEPALVDLL